MKGISFLLVFMTCSATLPAQEYRVIHQKDGSPVPYATIKVLHQAKGVIANGDGRFRLEISPTDTLLITSVGFKGLILPAAGMKREIPMQEANQKMKTLVIEKGLPRVNLQLGPKKWDARSEWNWGDSNDRTEFAQRIDLPSHADIYFLRRIVIPLGITDCSGPLLLHLYEVDSSGSPGAAFFQKAVFLDKKNVKKGQLSIDLATDRIQLEDMHAFFVGISWGTERFKGCPAILMSRTDSPQTVYSRTLTQPTYDWFRFGAGRDRFGLPMKLTTLYRAELYRVP